MDNYDALERIQGEVDTIAHKNEETGFCVVYLNVEDELISVVGELGDVEEGEQLILTGEFVDDSRFGLQFRVTMYERSLPNNAASILRYLSGGAISGIGPVLASQLVERFGDETLEIMEKDPERLVGLYGITDKKAKQFQKELRTSFAARALLAYLSEFKVGTAAGIRAWKRWGDHAQELISSNPYALCSEGIDVSFIKADEIASKQGIPFDSMYRIKAGITAVLKQNANNGHTCIPRDSLLTSTAKYLRVDKALVEKALTQETEDENIFIYQKNGRPFAMLRCYYIAEDYIARRLEVMKSISHDNKIDFSPVIDTEEEKNGIKYNSQQRQAINLALSEGFLVLTGGPGTGKTTTLNAIISMYKQQGLEVMIAAPTGRAAKRLSDLTGCEAKTIHRLLEVQPTSDERMTFVHKEDDQLECDALIVDEMSMVDSCLFEALLRAISVSCKLVLVGDHDQLPSVGPGNVLKDILDSGVMSVVTLTEIFRQAQESDIVMNAHKIVTGQHIDLSKRDKDFVFMQRTDYRELQSLVVELCKDRLPSHFGFSPLEDIQVLSPTKKGPSGTARLNELLQMELNPEDKSKPEIKRGGTIFRKGDKVMQTKNDYDVVWKRRTGKETESGTGIFNGDIGTITDVNELTKTLTIDFEGRQASYNGTMLSDLELAYAVTVHKSQGSEFDAVVLTVFGGYDKLYYRNLLYTAVTRAKKLLVIVGSIKCLQQMIDNNNKNLRYTALKNMLMEYVEGSDDGQGTFDI